MIVIQTVLKPSPENNCREVVLKVKLKDKCCRLPTGVRLSTSDFELIEDSKHPPNKTEKLNIRLLLAKEEINRSKTILLGILESSNIYFIHEVEKRYANKKSQTTLFQLFGRTIKQKQREGLIATAASYSATLSCFQKLLNYKDCTLESITKSCIRKWIEKLKKQDISHNTATFYLRNLRSLLVSSSKKNKFRQIFQSYKIKQHKTLKRSLTKEEIQFLLNYDVSDSPKLEKAKDFFTMTLFLRGMPTIDLIYLKKYNLTGDYISYTRHKTGVALQVKVLPFVAILLKKYRSSNNSSYLLEILKDNESEQANFKRYRNFLRNYNRNLNILGDLLGFSIPLSSYVARHTWATQAKYIGTTITLISESLGHSSEKITYSYLKEFERNKLDEVNYNVYQNILS